MNWVVLGEKNGLIQLVSKGDIGGMLPKGTFLTIEDVGCKFVLRVVDSSQIEPFLPSPMVVDMDLDPLVQDRYCKNLVFCQRIYSLSSRTDGLIGYIKPQSLARLSTQGEIDECMGSSKGTKVFAATVQYEQNHVIRDATGKHVTVSLPDEMFFHQTLVSGKTGSGKTVCVKYLSQYFVEEYGGAVLAINVKEADLLKMDLPSSLTNQQVCAEWETLGESAHGIDNFIVYYPANTTISKTRGVTTNRCQSITLDVKKIDPESLTGLLQNISDAGAMSFPNIFRFWQNRERSKKDKTEFTFFNFINYFRSMEDHNHKFDTLNFRGEESEVRLHPGTFENIRRNLEVAADFFDNPGAKIIDETDILQKGKMSVIDVAGNKGIQFGSILLRELLHQIVYAKSERKSEVPILIIIDEVHQFYNTSAAYDALGDLDTICRTGRSQKIGVIFSSQNTNDIPRGLSSVINTKIIFKSDNIGKIPGINLSVQEMETLKSGFAVASIHDLPSLKILKFPLAFAGVN